MKLKRILSAIMALAISVSAFAGLATTAFAEAIEYGEYTTLDSLRTIVTADTDGTAITANDDTKNGRLQITSPNAIMELDVEKDYVITFRTKSNGGKSNDYVTVSLLDETGNALVEGNTINNSGDGADVTVTVNNTNTEEVSNLTQHHLKADTTNSHDTAANAKVKYIQITLTKKSSSSPYIAFYTPVVVTNPSNSVSATFTEANGVEADVTVYSDEAMTVQVSSDTLAPDTKYYYKAVAYSYKDCTGNFTTTSEGAAVTFTMVKKESAALTIKYVDENDNDNVLKTVDVLDEIYKDDTYTYISSIYFIGNDGKLYKAKASGRANNDDIYDHNITLAETTNEYSINATLVCDSGFQLVEFDGSTDIASNRQRMASNGAATLIGKTKTDLLTVGTAGVYKVIVQTASIKNGVSNDGYLYVNDTEVAVLDVYTTTATTTIDKITLAADDVIFAQGTNSNTGVDYIVIIPVADGEEFTFAEEVQFATNAEKTAGTLRFKAGVLSKGFETISYGFRFVNIKDEGVEVKQLEVGVGEGDIAVNSVFYHDVTDIPNEIDGVAVVGVGFYALPYVCGVDGEFFYGTPFTFNGELDWTADIQTETK